MVKGTIENIGGSGKQQLIRKVASSLGRNEERAPLWSEKHQLLTLEAFFLSKDPE